MKSRHELMLVGVASALLGATVAEVIHAQANTSAGFLNPHAEVIDTLRVFPILPSLKFMR